MKYLFTFLFLCISILTIGQNCANGIRFKSQIFDSVIVKENIVYGVADRLKAPYTPETHTTPDTLLLDIYEPFGDNFTKRPLVIFAFGGGFLIGGKEDEDAKSVCTYLAKRGYTAVSIEYRLKMNIASNNSATRAAYRGIQDYSAAVRYLKEYANNYKLDTNFVFYGGVSAGSISAMGLAFMEEADRPIPSYGWNGTLFDADSMDCINCSGNNYKHNVKPKAIFNCWGAIQDTSFLTAKDSIPLLSFHGVKDKTVPYESGVPFVAMFQMDKLYGSYSINKRMKNVGLQSDLVSFPNEGHNIWGEVLNNKFLTGPSKHLNPILKKIGEFLYPFVKDYGIQKPTIIQVKNTIETQDTYSSYQWFENGMIANVTTKTLSSPINGAMYQVQGFDANGCWKISEPFFFNSTGIENMHSTYFQLFPNPAKEFINVTTSVFNTFKVKIYNLQGELVLSQNSDSNSTKININQLPQGAYFYTISVDKNILKFGKLMISSKN